MKHIWNSCICDATLSDVYVVLCYVLLQYPNSANTGYEPGHIAILIIKLYSRNNHHMTNDIFSIYNITVLYAG
jgi:hypothetical protein